MSAAGAALVVLAALAALAAVSAACLRPPRPGPGRRGTHDFSTERALRHVETIAARPHPAGSAANAAVRDYLLDVLRGYGLRPELRGALTVRTSGSGVPLVGRAENIVCDLPSAPAPGDGGIVLMAHYDSAPGAPGAADDAAAVATVLETARALAASGPQPRPVRVVLTDAEEPGLLGAAAEVPGWTGASGATDVLNFEARGVSGPAVMFQTGPDGRRMAAALGRTRRPVATSLAGEVYRRLPNTTDFTEALAAGHSGMDIAFIGGSAHYHTAGDSVRNLSPASLTHMGTTAAGAVRALLRDRPARATAPGGPTADPAPPADPAPRRGRRPAPRTAAVYFPLPGVLARYPVRLARPLALLGLALYAASAAVAARTPAMRAGPGAVALCALGAAALPVAAGLLGLAAWYALTALRPEVRGYVTGDSHRPGPYKAGMLGLTTALGLAGCALTAGRYGPAAACLGTWGCAALLAALTAETAPGMSYLFTWPALTGPAALLATAAADPHWDSGRAASWLPAATAYAACALLVFVPVAVLLPAALGLAGTDVTMAVTAFPAAALGCAALPLPHWWTAGAVATAGLMCAAAGAWRDRPDEQHPSHVSLVHVTDTGRGVAWWVTRERTPSPWVRAHTGSGRDGPPDGVPSMPELPAPPYAGKAARAGERGPEAERVEERETGDVRHLLLRLRAPAGASWLWLLADTSRHAVVAVTVDGLKVEQPEPRRASDGGSPGTRSPAGRWQAVLAFHAPPPQGLSVRVSVRGRGPLPVHLAAHTYGIPPEFLHRPLPATHTWSPVAANWTVAMRDLSL